RAIALASFETYREHRWIVLLGIQPGLGPKTRRFGEVALRVFGPLELDLPTRINVLAALNNYIFVFIHRAIAWGQLRERSGLSDEEWNARLQTYLEEAREQDAAIAQQM